MIAMNRTYDSLVKLRTVPEYVLWRGIHPSIVPSSSTLRTSRIAQQRCAKTTGHWIFQIYSIVPLWNERDSNGTSFYFSSNATNEINKCSRWNLFDSRYNRIRLNKVIYISKYLYENVRLHRVEANSKIFIGSRSEFTTYHFYSQSSNRRAYETAYYLGEKFKYLANVRKLDSSDRNDRTGFLRSATSREGLFWLLNGRVYIISAPVRPSWNDSCD